MGEAKRRKLAGIDQAGRHDALTRHYWEVKLGKKITDEDLAFFKTNATANQGNPEYPTIDKWQESAKNMLAPGGVCMMISGDRLWTYNKPKVNV